ncbi:hypothetical protein CROQUDRAFT_717209 [Cronartium quercuum f. sp. fusiforme G11]|uniref:Uncharacterized protein n=1 Tax=Cronartium quercuum f. sp. fusiforme G11 TaxID=708437 RepID=A0A9P6NFP0_9BASI|nr:hypothetical protein CROQUDRAFT_717209 [Cronartium quercuum f. sp. fusiforme G11]
MDKFASNKLSKMVNLETGWSPYMPINNVDDAKFFFEHFDPESFTKYIQYLGQRDPKSRDLQSLRKLTKGPEGVSSQETILRIETLYKPLTLAEIMVAKGSWASIEAQKTTDDSIPAVHELLTKFHESASNPFKDPALLTSDAKADRSAWNSDTKLSTKNQNSYTEGPQRLLGSLHTFVLKYQALSAIDSELSREITKVYVVTMTRYYDHPEISQLAWLFYDYMRKGREGREHDFIYRLDLVPEAYDR